MYKLLFCFIWLVGVTGCATTDNGPVTGDKSTSGRLGNAIISPLNDLNLVYKKIPPVLVEAERNPYQLPSTISCEVLTAQINHLDTVLGLDLDAILIADEKTIQEKGSAFVQDEAVGSVERTINGAIPFRGWIRKLSGAERHSRELITAIAAGVVRRAFLKGIGQEHGCKPPASPLRYSPAQIRFPEEAPNVDPVTVAKEEPVAVPASEVNLPEQTSDKQNTPTEMTVAH